MWVFPGIYFICVISVDSSHNKPRVDFCAEWRLLPILVLVYNMNNLGTRKSRKSKN